ncbi:TetR/AcrR family transcriptional regulator [Micromonospora sp. CPCC 205371]|nr:TetR/AcrR family transcriptional regulator [Micromonospora sp. CPCC 205371]
MTSDVSLRERKKQATRAALSHAAWSLMIERGLEAVTPEAVAEAVDVSPRTFRNYFASREEAILYGLVRRAGSIGDALRARPAGEPVWDSLMEVLPVTVAGLVGESRDLLLLMDAILRDPAMFAQHLVAFEHAQELLVAEIADRMGATPCDLSPRLLAAATGVAIRAAVVTWAQSATDASAADLIRESLAVLRAGIPLGEV